MGKMTWFTKNKGVAEERVTTPESSEFSIDHEKDPAAIEEVRSDSIPHNQVEAVLHELKEETAAHEGEDDIEYPSSWKLGIIVVSLCLAVFCMALDNTIIATAIPRITDQFHSIDDVGWYGSAYLLTTCAFQLFYGKLYTYYPIKYIFLGALFIFEVGSVVCGAAPSSKALIVGRAVAGLGSAGLFSGSILILAHSVPLVKRPTYTGLIGAMYGVASIAGPLMGGAFTDHVSWRWCFYINLPIGLVTAVFMVVFFKAPDRKETVSTPWRQQMGAFDLPGLAALLPCVICLLLALQWGGSSYNWGNWRIIFLFCLFAVLALAFGAIQVWKGEAGTVPPRILKQRTVLASAVFSLFLGASFFAIIYFLPIWFQAIKGVSAVESGIRNLPLLISCVLFMIGSGVIVTIVGYFTPFTIVSSVFMAIGAGLITTWEVDTSSGRWIGFQIIYGAGVGFGMSQTLIAVQTVLPLTDVPIGTAIIMFAQTLGGALFISVAQNVFTNGLLTNLKAVVPDLEPSVVLNVGATSLRNVVGAKDLSGVLFAYNKTLTHTFFVSVATGALSIFGSIFMEWKSVKGKKVDMAVA